MKIEQVAQKTGLSVHTLRYYERAGLVQSIRRASNGHRDYSDDDVYRIIFVTRLRATGMPISGIQRYVELAQQGDGTVAERLRILEDHKHAIEAKIEMLQENLALISQKIDHYRAMNHMIAAEPMVASAN